MNACFDLFGISSARSSRDLNPRHHCWEAANTARRLLFMVRRSFCELSKAPFTPLYCALVRPHLRTGVNQLERVQRLAIRLVRGLRHVPYEERLRQLNLFSLERRRLRADLILAFKIFKGEVDLNPSEFFLRPPRAGLRGHTSRLLQGPSRLRRRSGAFSRRVVKFWNRLPAHLILSPSVSIFKKQLNRQWSEIFPAAPVSPFIDNFLNTLTPNLRPAYVVITGPRGHSYH